MNTCNLETSSPSNLFYRLHAEMLGQSSGCPYYVMLQSLLGLLSRYSSVYFRSFARPFTDELFVGRVNSQTLSVD